MEAIVVTIQACCPCPDGVLPWTVLLILTRRLPMGNRTESVSRCVHYSRIAPKSCRCCCNFCRGMSHAFGGVPTLRATIGMRLASHEGTHVSANAPSEAVPAFTSNDGVSYLRNPDTGSEIWLVGVVHGQETSVEVNGTVDTVVHNSCYCKFQFGAPQVWGLQPPMLCDLQRLC